MKKIAIVFTGLPYGGIETAAVNMLNNIDLKKYSISLYTDIEDENYLRRFPEEAHIYNLKKYAPRVMAQKCINERKYLSFLIIYCMHILDRLLRYVGKKTNIRYRCSYISKEKFDCAIAYKQCGPAIRTILYRFHSQKKIIWVHGEWVHSECVQDDVADYSYPRIMYPKFDKVICVSEVMKRKLNSNIPSLAAKTQVIYNILNEEEIIAKSKEYVDFCKMEDEFLVCSVGRLVGLKQFHLAICAARIILDYGLKIRWILCGEGDDRERLEKLIIDNHLESTFLILGYQDNPYKYMRISDVFCHTSRTEGFGLVLQEAKILKMPVVTTNFPAAYEIIADKKDGMIVEQNPASIAEAIIELLTDKNKRIAYSGWSKKISAERSRQDINLLLSE